MKRKGKVILIGVFILLGILFLSFIYFNTKVYNSYSANPTVKSASLASHTVLIGTVESIHSAKWNSRDGNKPRNSPNVEIIFRPTVIKVDEYLKNPQNEKKITIINVGGRIGFDTVGFDDKPQTFKQGQKVVLFLLKDIDPGDGIKYYDPIYSFEIKGNIAINTVTDEKIELQTLKSEIIAAK